MRLAPFAQAGFLKLEWYVPRLMENKTDGVKQQLPMPGHMFVGLCALGIINLAAFLAFMKANTRGWLAALAVSGVLAFGAESLIVAPGASSTYDVVQSPVLKIYTAMDGKHRFIAYLVKWKNAEVIVSDPLAQSNYKVGDTISFLAQKTTLEEKGSATIDSLSFILTAPTRK